MHTSSFESQSSPLDSIPSSVREELLKPFVERFKDILPHNTADRESAIFSFINQFHNLRSSIEMNPIDASAIDIDTVRDLFRRCIVCLDHFCTFSSAAAEKEFTDLAVANYLMLCLDSSKDAVQTLNSFIDHGSKYITQSEKTDLLSGQASDSAKKSIQRAHKKWEKLVSAYQKEAKEKSYPFPPLPKKIKNCKNSERPIRFSDLCFCDLYSQGRLSLYCDLVHPKRHFFGKSKADTSFYRLKDSLKMHSYIYNNVKGTAESDPQRYVATCAFLLKYEEAFQFTTIGKMVQHYCEKIELSPSDDTDDFRLACFCALYIVFVLPISHYMSLRTVNDVTLDRDINTIIDMVFSRKEEIKLHHIPQDRVETMDPKSVLNQFSPEACSICETYRRDRVLFTNAFHLLLSLCSPKQLANIQWGNRTFSYVVRFFKNEYPLIENYIDIDFGTAGLSNPAYNLFMEHYNYACKHKKDPISVLRKHILGDSKRKQ